MATQPDDLIDDTVDDAELPDSAADESAEDGDQDDTNDQQQDDSEEHDVVTWGDAAVEAADEPEGMRNLRARLREVERENKALKAPAKVEELGTRPTLEDFDYDDDRHAEALEAWLTKKREASERETQQQVAARKQQERWEAQSRDLDTGYSELRAPGKDAARSTVEDQFPGEQFAYLVKAAGKNAPAFILALGNASERRDELKALAAEGSWAEFIATAAVMAKEVKLQPRKPATAPDQNYAARGASGGGANAAAKTLERLEAEAERTGDRSKIIAYRRQQRENGK